jgi:hypothetical protein
MDGLASLTLWCAHSVTLPGFSSYTITGQLGTQTGIGLVSISVQGLMTGLSHVTRGSSLGAIRCHDPHHGNPRIAPTSNLRPSFIDTVMQQIVQCLGSQS